MRSRYTAYALGEVDYVLETTHPDGPQAERDREEWRRSVERFSRESTFEALEVLAHETQGDVAWVTFRAQVSDRGRDRSFVERSEFRRVDGRWLYFGAARA